MQTLHTLDSDGFSEEHIASSLNTVEFTLREGGGGLRGMEVFLGSLQKWNYDLNPKDALVYEDALKLLKENIETTGSNIFQQMIRDFLINNSHRVVLELYPSATQEEEQLQVRSFRSMSDPRHSSPRFMLKTLLFHLLSFCRTKKYKYLVLSPR